MAKNYREYANSNSIKVDTCSCLSIIKGRVISMADREGYTITRNSPVHTKFNQTQVVPNFGFRLNSGFLVTPASERGNEFALISVIPDGRGLFDLNPDKYEN